MARVRLGRERPSVGQTQTKGKLNLVERWFRNLTDKAMRRGVFPSVLSLIEAIEAYLAARNDAPRPFVWTATVGDIVAKLDRARQRVESTQPGCTLPRRRKTAKVVTV